MAEKNDTIRVAVAQIGTDENVEANLCKIEQKIEEAAHRECSVILFHEGCLTGYPDAGALGRLDFQAVAWAEKRVKNMAQELQIAVLLGTTSRKEESTRNELLIITEDGNLVGRYAKTWRAGEAWYSAGSGPVIFRICGIDCTAIICHDLRYPELVRLGVAAGARIVFIANNEAGLDREDKQLGYRSMQISRATENYVFGVMANPPADPAGFGRYNSSHGNSKIIDPLGNVLDEAGWFEERLVTADLDMSKADASVVLRTMGTDPASNRRYGSGPEHEAYAAWIKQGLSLVKRLN